METSTNTESAPSLPLQYRESVSPQKARSRFLFWEALVGFFAFDLLGLGRSFRRMHRLVSNWPVACEKRVNITQACHAINHACVWYPKRVLCLQRSAVMTCLMRSGGLPATMVMGAQNMPFKAHAWTEVDGRPINERRDVQNIYDVWDRC